MRKTSSWEYRNLLTTGDWIHCVNGGDSRLNHLFRINPRVRIDRRTFPQRTNVRGCVALRRYQRNHTIDVKIILWKYFGTIVNRVTWTIEDTTQHVLCDWKLHTTSRELNVCGLHINSRGSFKHLYNSLLPLHLKDLAPSFRTVGQSKLNDFIIRCKLAFKSSGRSFK